MLEETIYNQTQDIVKKRVLALFKMKKSKIIMKGQTDKVIQKKIYELEEMLSW
ncbi:8157_t:CDS:2 [Gigaspora margarita]|uniref:8157_t:CDS:1 n=1 Tax=Gigaspora margarita TaxID=4874 RepID=A0ABM8W4B4_GIGMA|nr:8157_t:CDS:2 [Gigaspora margarita]